MADLPCSSILLDLVLYTQLKQFCQPHAIHLIIFSDLLNINSLCLYLNVGGRKNVNKLISFGHIEQVASKAVEYPPRV